MKRCPECDFLYLDSDQVCDLDGAILGKVDLNTTTSHNQPEVQSRRQAWKTFALLIVPGLVFGIVLVVVSNWVLAKRQHNVNHERTTTLTTLPTPVPEPSAVSSPSPVQEVSALVSKASPAKIAPTPRLSSNPISTESGKNARHALIIRLNDGGTITADDVWRTKDGIWYRRNGVVTLLKRRQVKAIETAP
jgi:hypothetical protein